MRSFSIDADYQYGWHHDGEEIIDGDGDPRTHGVLAPDGYDPNKSFGATTAIGNVDVAGPFEVCNVGWSIDSLYVWDHQGLLLPGVRYAHTGRNSNYEPLDDLPERTVTGHLYDVVVGGVMRFSGERDYGMDLPWEGARTGGEKDGTGGWTRTTDPQIHNLVL